MNRFVTTVLATLVLTPSLYGASKTTHMWCDSLENPSTLFIKLQSPDPKHQCDIDYQEDFCKTEVNYTLTSDLSNPHTPKPSANQAPVTDTLFENEEDGLHILHGDFDITLAAGFRHLLNAGQKVPVTIESHVVTEGTGTFQLYCQLR